MKTADLSRDLDAARRRLLTAVSGVTEDQFKQRPAPTDADPEPWCIAEVLAHMLWSELLWAGRMALVFQDGGTIEPASVEASTAAAAEGRRAPVPGILHGIVAARRQVEQRIAGIDDADLDRDAWHAGTQKRVTLATMVQTVIDHENEHTDQIEGIRDRLGLSVIAAAEVVLP